MGSPFDFSSLSTTVNDLPETNIVEVARYGWGRQGLIPLWFGEGDVPTPAFISDACHESMIEGDTFYTDQNGITELREELIEYNKRTFDIRLNQDRVTVTNSGMMAITTVMQALLNPGDEVVVIGPVWPNIYSAISINRGIATHASITLQDNAWILDLKDVFAAISASTKAIFLNSPGNPTGWIMPEEDQKELLNFCREKGIWIVSDEVYHSLVFDRPVANSILKYASPNDKVISVNSFSKSWLMTGWRMGWIVHPVGLSETFAKLIQISTSGVPAFIQKAGIAALSKGDQVVSDLRDRCQIGRDIVFDYLEQWPRVRCMRPKGAFYAFFSVEGMENSLEFCKTLIDKCNVGLAPGSAFGPGGEGFLRLCFASTPDKLNEAMKALGKEIGGR
ncbi:MAG: pyridoxal phosphate-dependent aminotransferase [Pseudomonadota bacterium]|jgi:aspartate aminotransferase|nr:pyridoxal phosphate-dependent aminotransferase [Pseudomonadota bacterium]MED5225700.1 pyridoxal phosphate-dependent aminotransferase [Pseudomonadota bacterium]|tara:strand:- start:2464 stop:3639 length:1176 start_codon:yes stop_codon:yes gene_type:complete